MRQWRRILLVDDDEATLELERSILTSRGYVCDCVRSGEDALAALCETRYHLVILDVNMPGGEDGFAVAERLRREPEFGEPYVIFVTARADVASASLGFASGGVLYLTKPFTSAKLLDVVQAVTEMG